MESDTEMKAVLEKRKRIGDFLYEHKGQLDRLREGKKIPNSDWVIEFAENITMASKAPKHWAAPRPLHEFRGHPPAPQFEQMRAGKLEEYHQKAKKSGDVGEIMDFVQIPPLITFERTKPTVTKSASNKRGRDADAEEEEDAIAIAKKMKSNEDEAAASRLAALQNATSRKATTAFGLDDDDSSDSD